MAAIINDRDVLLQAAGTRLLPVTLPSNVDTSGNHTGTLSGSGQVNFQNTQISLSSTGSLQNAGGGQIDDLDYTNISGSKPPSNADNTQTKLENAATSIEVNSSTFLEMPGGGSAGVFLGSGGLFGKDTGGNTTFSIDASDGDAIFKGDITGGANIDITGSANFDGSTSGNGLNAAGMFNASFNQSIGVIGFDGSGSGDDGVLGVAQGSNASGVRGLALNSSAIGVKAQGAGGVALQVSGGTMTISSATKVTNLYADRAALADAVAGANVSGTVPNATNAANATNASNSNSLGNVPDDEWCRGIVCDVGTAQAAGFGFSLTSTVSGVETAVSGGNNIVIRNISDESKKHNPRPENLGMDFVHELAELASTFEHENIPGKRCHGFVSQQVDKIKRDENDYLTHVHDDGLMGLDYQSLISILVFNLSKVGKELAMVKSQVASLRRQLGGNN